MRRFRFLLVPLLVLLAIAGLVLHVAAVRAIHEIVRDVHAADVLHELSTGPQATIVLDRQGAPLTMFFRERRVDVSLDQIAPIAVDAVLAAEDRRFYAHDGLDPIRIAGAAIANLRAGRILQGGSTITQQLVRAAALSPARTFARKIREALLAAEIEQRYTKDEILEAYLNTVYFGNGRYGIEAAARGYFSTHASLLTASQAATLAGIIRAPSALAPTVAPRLARERRDEVLHAMGAAGLLAEARLRQALAEPLSLMPRRHDETHQHDAAACAMYFVEQVRLELVERLGAETVYRGGLRVTTTLDPDRQAVAEQVIRTRLAEIEDARAFRRIDRPPDATLQGALVSLDPRTGEVLALVGGRDFHESPFNRATQARRQPGSAFKPIVFSAALEAGYAPGSLLSNLDEPIPAVGGPWLPDDQAGEAPSYTLSRALKVSSNRAAARLLQLIGPRAAIEQARSLGITSDLPEVPSLALGVGEVTLLELTGAYGTLANEGVRVRPTLIRRVEASDGRVLWEHRPAAARVVSPATAFFMSSMLRGVIEGGTGHRVREDGFDLPAAGKTGSTDGFADAWFVGYVPTLATGVWFGFDTPATIMREGFGGRVAAPAWAAYMKAAVDGDEPGWYEAPETVERVAICRVSGGRARSSCHEAARAGSVAYRVREDGGIQLLPRSQVEEALFPAGAIPAWCSVHGRRSQTAPAGDSAGTIHVVRPPS